MLSVNIVSLDNGAGLSRDAQLLVDTLAAAGMRPRWFKGYVQHKGIRLLQRKGLLNWMLPRYDVNIFLERFHPSWFPTARKNVLIPNPEWFMPGEAPNLGGIDAVLCKSQDAVTTFSALGKSARWVGFTSENRYAGKVAAGEPMRALHVAGRSPHKGTAGLLSVWRKHPEWPMLTVVQRPLDEHTILDTVPAANIRFLTHRLTDAEILELQHTHPLHVMPSEVEGYGQAIAEAMSIGAIVLTTDAAPMNELVQPGRGIVVATHEIGKLHLATLVRADDAALEAAIADVLTWTVERCTAVGTAAREWFVANDKRFHADFPIALRDVVAA